MQHFLTKLFSITAAACVFAILISANATATTVYVAGTFDQSLHGPLDGGSFSGSFNISFPIPATFQSLSTYDILLKNSLGVTVVEIKNGQSGSFGEVFGEFEVQDAALNLQFIDSHSNFLELFFALPFTGNAPVLLHTTTGYASDVGLNSTQDSMVKTGVASQIPLPEPAAYLLVPGGLVALVFLRRRGLAVNRRAKNRAAAIARLHGFGLLQTLVLIVALTGAFASTAHATTSFGTTASGTLGYNPNNTYAYMSNGFNPNLPAWIWSTGGFEFTVPQDDLIDSLTVPLRSFENSTVTMSLYSGGSTPQTLLETSSLSIPVVDGFGYQLFTFNFSGTTHLLPGQNYFLIGTVPQSTINTYEVQWAGNTEGVSVPWAAGETWLTGQFAPNGFLGWNTTTFSSGPAWQINAQQVTPEPAAFALAGLGLLAIGLIRIGRNK
jgi:PEP-CTERM motif